MQKLTTIPFSGFYESLHDSALSDSLEYVFQDDHGNTNETLHYRAVDAVQWREVYLSYAQEYAANFAAEFGVKSLKFESMKSPKYYNFETDRIFCHIDESEVYRLFASVDSVSFAEYLREKFTSRDGFSSFYSPDLDSWGNPSTWDHNQIGALLEFIAGADFDQWREVDLMENARGNGKFDDWIFGSNPKELNRLDKVSYYLRERANRA